MITSTKKLSLAAVSALALAVAMPAGSALADDEMAEYGHDLQASSMASPTASSAADSLESLAGTAFAPLSAPVKYVRDDMGRLGVVMLDEGEAVHVGSITSDGKGGFTVVYVVNGESDEVQFGPEDYTGNDYYKQTDDAEYWFWHAPIGANFENVARQYFSFVGWVRGTEEGWPRGHSAYGVLTPAGRLVDLGSATYEGHINADVWQNFTGLDRPDIQGFLWGEMTLEADFSEGTISGDVDNLWYLPPEQEWLRMPETNSLVISNGEVVESRFHADWHGQDTDADADYSESVRDLDGSMLGAFYGPNGEEVGGLFTGQREETDEVLNGRFGGESHAATMTRELWGKFIPGRAEGIAVSPGAAVYADSSEDTLSNLLPGGHTVFAPLSASVSRDWWPEQQTMHPDSGGAYVKSISSDGVNGFRVTYVIDGRESVVHFSADDVVDEWGSFNVNRGPGGNSYWLYSRTDSMSRDPESRTSGSSEFAYFDINGWSACGPSYCFEGYSTYGARTRAVDMPSGSATYEGRIHAGVWDGDKPDHLTRRNVHGDLTLEADFDRSAISGRVDGIAVRPETSNDWSSLGEGNSLDISNGRIVGSWFDADWAGVDTDAGSAPENSMRGFEGTLEGEFFGPAGEEVGGVLGGLRAATATTPAQYIHGGFGARQQD